MTDQHGLSPEIDGVLGLTLGGKMADTPTDFKVGPLFLEKLYEEGNITQKAFSTHFSTVEGNSFVDFGPPKEQNMNVATKQTIQVDNSFFWTATPAGVRFTDSDGDVREYALDGYKAVFSSAADFSMVPAPLAKLFFKKFLRGIRRDEEQGVMFIDCNADIPDVKILIDNIWYEMKGSDLINDMSANQDGSLCAVGFIPNMDNVWILGHAFYKDYYITHHAQAMYMSVASDELGTKSAPEVAGEIPTSRITDDYDWFMFLAKFLAGGAMSVGYWAIITYVFEPASFTGFNFLN